MIDDPELRNLFRAESEEHLQTLESGLLHLETQPGDRATLDQLFRSAHSLKGSARMLGMENLETLAHHFEDELGAARRGQRAMSGAAADRLYQGLDAMRLLTLEACGGETAQIDISDVLARLRGTSAPKRSVSDSASTQEDAKDVVAEGETEDRPESDEVAPEARTAEAAAPAVTGAVTASSKSSEFKIETIRVEPQALDALMTLAGEMAVTTARVAKALSVIGELADLWEEGQRGDSGKAVQTQSNREPERVAQIRALLVRLERTGEHEIGRLGMVAGEMSDSIRNLRLLPFSTIFNLFPRMVRDLSHEQGKEVQLEVTGGAVCADKHVLEELKDPLMHLIRNAIDHAIEDPAQRQAIGKSREAVIHLKAWRSASRMVIEVSDDGRGLNEKQIRETAIRKHLLTEEAVSALSAEAIHRLIFTSGFSTKALVTDVSGRGVGLDVVRTNVERLKGTISVESEPGLGCTFRVEAPMSLATTRVLLVRLGKRPYAIPLEAIQQTFLLSPKAVFSMDGRRAIQWGGQAILVAHLVDLLELKSQRNIGREREDQVQPGIVVVVGANRVGLFVDELLDEQEVIVKPFGGALKRVRNVLGSTILSTGEVCMVLNPEDLTTNARSRTIGAGGESKNLESERKKVILLAEDSITTRTQEKRILEGAGYDVVTAVDGADAFSKLDSRAFDAVVTDIEMPNMTGLQLTERIRKEPRYKDLPIILVTSLASDEDRKLGAAVGANAYVTKGTFDQKLLLEALRRLV